MPEASKSEILNNTKIKTDLKNHDKATEDLIDDIIKYYGRDVTEIGGWIFFVVLVVVIIAILGGCILWCRMKGCYRRCCEVCFNC